MNETKLTSKAWLVLFCVTVAVLVFVIWPGLNYLVDPFGAFGDPIFKWWSYDATMNPRVAKTTYLEENHEKYDSYIIGCSSTSSYPVEAFNEALDASFYNLIVYGSDLYDTEQFAAYLLEHYEVKNLVVNVYIGNGVTYDIGEDSLENAMHYKVSGTSALSYYLRYLFADPRMALDKLTYARTDGYVQAAHDVFDEDSGAYDKSRRDAEGIGALDEYLRRSAYSAFQNYPKNNMTMSHIDDAAASVAKIKAMCDEKGVNLIVAACPIYAEAMDWFDRDEVEAFYAAIASVVDLWDFSYSSVSFEPRYFYDTTHFRNAVGEMMAARIFGDDTVYVPEDFGALVTADTAEMHFSDDYWDKEPISEAALTTKVPILLYHHLVEVYEENDSTVSVETFEAQIKALADAGYTAVTFSDLSDYVERGVPLPEKPVVITFDDGYESNLTMAAPILRQYNMNATVFVIGVSVGKDTYKDTGVSMLPHFSWDAAAAAEASGVITIESHGYDFHEVEGRDLSPIRVGILQKSGESESDYIAFLNGDCDTMNRYFADYLGKSVTVVAYPYGYHSDLTDIVMAENGVTATVTTSEHTNTLVKGLPQSLYNLGRYTIHEDTDILAVLEGA